MCPPPTGQVLPRGTGFLTDLGMTGPAQSVLGMRPFQAMNRFLGGLPMRFEPADGPCKLEGAVFSIDTRRPPLPVRDPAGHRRVIFPPKGALPPLCCTSSTGRTCIWTPPSPLCPRRRPGSAGEQRELIERLTGLARSRGADLLVLSGDLFDSADTYAETTQALCRSLGQTGCPRVHRPGQPRLLRGPVPPTPPSPGRRTSTSSPPPPWSG